MKVLLFQSTPLHEGRPMQLDNRWFNAGFNPRPYMRGDAQCVGMSYPSMFQSTPLHEGRLSDGVVRVIKAVSIHAPT